MLIIALAVVAGIVWMWIFQGLIDWLIIGRVMDDPVNGKFLSTIIAYVINTGFSFFSTGSTLGFLTFLPGALLIGWLQYRKGLKIRRKMVEEDVGTVFE